MELKPLNVVNKRNNAIMGLIVFAITMGVYMMTHARSLSFWDSGEYITCSSILGVPHPPGNPFYIILGRFFCILGGGIPHAFIVSSISSLLSAFAVLFTYLFTVKLVSMFEKNQWLIMLTGVIAAFLTAFSFTFWMNAIEAEVYGGLAIVVNMIMWLTLVWMEKQENFSHQNILLLIIYVFFLGFCIHQTSLQIAPAVLFIVTYPYIRNLAKSSSFWTKIVIFTISLLALYFIFNGIGDKMNIPVLGKFAFGFGFFLILYIYMKELIDSRVWWMTFVLILVGFSPHLFLWIRSEFRPFINEGYPHTWNLFMDYILRRQYGVTSFAERRASLGYQIDFHFLRYLWWQFFHVETIAGWLKMSVTPIQILANWFVALSGIGGFIYTFKKNKHSFAYLFAFFFMASIAMIFVMNLSDKEVRDRDYFFVTAYNLYAVAMAIGMLGFVRLFEKAKPYITAAIAIVMLIFPALTLASQYYIHDRTYENLSIDYGTNIINSVEKNAIIFTNGDNDTFPIWYAQAVKDPNAREFCYPAKDVYPTPDTKKLIENAMSFKNSECFGIRKDVTIANLSLLNTPWYIRQLRDKEGVEFNIPDEKIDGLTPVQLPEDVTIAITSPNPNDNFEVTLKKNAFLLIKDVAVIQIIKDNYGKRPIYFAVTVSDVSGFDGFLRNEGMVDRLVPVQIDNNLDINRLENNIEKVYSYRGITDKRLYKDDNMLRLINNYGAAYMRASTYYQALKNYDKAIAYYNSALTFITEKEHFNGPKAVLLAEAGKRAEAKQLMLNHYNNNPKDPQTVIQTSLVFLKIGEINDGFTFLEKAAMLDPTNKQMASLILTAAIQYNNRAKGIELLEKLRSYQDNNMIDQMISGLRDPKFTLPPDMRI